MTAPDISTRVWPEPRVITTAEELDTLPMGAVVLDRDDDPWHKIPNSGLWWCTDPGIEEGYDSFDMFDAFGPVKVLYIPA